MFFENIDLELGDKVKIFINDNTYYVGEVKSRYDWFAQNKTFYYVETKRKVTNSTIAPSDCDKPLCVAAWSGLVKKVR